MTTKHRWAAALSAAVLAAGSSAAADEEPPIDNPTTPVDETRPTETQAATAEALASQPQVTAIRGGTLGIPSATTSGGLQAAFDAKAIGSTGEDTDAAATPEPDSSTFDFFAKLGRISLTDQFDAEVIADQFHMDMPRITVGMAGAVPIATTTELTSVGLRLSYRTRPSKVNVFGTTPGEAEAPSNDAETERATRETLDKLFEKTSGWLFSAGVRVTRRETAATELKDFNNGGSFELMVQRSVERSPAPDAKCEQAKVTTQKAANQAVIDAKKKVDAATAARSQVAQQLILLAKGETQAATIEALLANDAAAPRTVEAASKVATASIEAAERAVVAAEAEQKEANKAKADAAKQTCPKRVDVLITGYGSLSGTYLNEEQRAIDGAMVLFPRWKELRATVGVDLQTSKIVTGSKLLPRVGAYASVAWGFWTNEFGEAEQEDKIRARQWQAALYASGHVYKGLSGLLSIGLLIPYGHESRPAFVVSFSPAFTSGGAP